MSYIPSKTKDVHGKLSLGVFTYEKKGNVIG